VVCKGHSVSCIELLQLGHRIHCNIPAMHRKAEPCLVYQRWSKPCMFDMEPIDSVQGREKISPVLGHLGFSKKSLH
jgi:hypothetical protein